MTATPERPAIAADITIDALIERYLAGPALVRATIADMTAEQRLAKPIEGKMSTHDVVTHIVDSEKGLGGRIKRALAGEAPVPSTGGHPEIVCDPARDLAEELDTLQALREATAEQLRAVDADVWQRPAMHMRDREIDVRGVLTLMTRHLETHVATIEEKRAALGL
jgi:uncharacterized damage-inducible protein DinB